MCFRLWNQAGGVTAIFRAMQRLVGEATLQVKGTDMLLTLISEERQVGKELPLFDPVSGCVICLSRSVARVRSRSFMSGVAFDWQTFSPRTVLPQRSRLRYTIIMFCRVSGSSTSGRSPISRYSPLCRLQSASGPRLAPTLMTLPRWRSGRTRA